jgi:hypothetical protein
LRTGTGSLPLLLSLLAWCAGYLEGVVLEDRNRKSSSSGQPTELVHGVVLEDRNPKSASSSKPTDLVNLGVVLEDRNRKPTSSSQPTDLVRRLPGGCGT